MSLNFNYSTTLYNLLPATTQDELWYEVDSIIWNTIFVGMPEITDENVAEFFARVQMDKRVRGQEMVFSYSTLILMIGLKTNASRKTRAQWLKAITETVTTYTNEKAEDAVKSLETVKLQLPPIAVGADVL